MMQSYRKAAHLNNEGVRALAQGNGSVAVDCLSAALHIMKAEVAIQKRKHNSSSSTRCSSSSSSSSTSSEDDDEALGISTVELPFLQQEEHTDACHYIFNRGLLLPDCTSDVGDNDNDKASLSRRNVHVYTAVSIFNLSLAHHQNGVTERTHMIKKSISSLKKADQLYAVVLEFLAEKQSRVLLNSCWISAIIQLASINNLSQLWLHDEGQGECKRKYNGDHVREDFQLVRKAFESYSDLLFMVPGEPAIQRLVMTVLTMDGHARNASAA